MKGRMLGMRGPGRSRIGLLDELIENYTYGGAMKQRAEDRLEVGNLVVGGEFGHQEDLLYDRTLDDDNSFH